MVARTDDLFGHLLELAAEDRGGRAKLRLPAADAERDGASEDQSSGPEEVSHRPGNA